MHTLASIRACVVRPDNALDSCHNLFSCNTQDPLGLGKTDASLERFTEGEIINGRWAMLGVAGALVPEVLGQGDWYNAPLWVRLSFLTFPRVCIEFHLELHSMQWTGSVIFNQECPSAHCAWRLLMGFAASAAGRERR